VARRDPVEHPERECAAAECSARFTPVRSTATYCSVTCRKRAARARKAADAAAKADAVEAAGDAEHDLIRAIRGELARAGRLDTFKGQLALQLARRMVNPEESSPASLAKELQNVMTAALASSPSSEPDTAPAAEDDEVTKARMAREAKAAAAAASE